MDSPVVGLWVDGATRVPTVNHADKKYGVVIRKKDSGDFGVRPLACSQWNDVEWLDMTVPKVITPRQLFEMIKTLHPDASLIEKNGAGWTACGGVACVKVNWGDTRTYPIMDTWRPPADSDEVRKGKKCRVKRSQDDEWKIRTFICVFNNRFVVFNDETGCSEQYDICEVKDDGQAAR